MGGADLPQCVSNDAALSRLIEQVRDAADRRAPLQIRGGGSKAFYGEPARGDLLDTRPLAGISSYEPTELVVSVRAGTPLAELDATLAERGQYLPFEPPRFAQMSPGDGALPEPGPSTNTSTVGGMVAAGLSGPARAAVGCVRDFLLGATLVDGRGDVLTFGGQVMKNVAGYDASRVLAGSLGILGVICEVSLKVLPLPTASATLQFECDQVEALRRLNEWGGQPLPVNASAWYRGSLTVRLSGARAAVQAACQRLGGEAMSPEAAAAWWNGLRDHGHAALALSEAQLKRGERLWRLSLPSTAAPIAGRNEDVSTGLIEWGRRPALATPAACRTRRRA